MSLITEDDLKREIHRLERINRSLKKNLIDEFAKAALTGLLAESGTRPSTDRASKAAFEYATEMLKARETVCVPTA